MVKSLEKIFPFEIFNLGGNGSIDLETYVNLIEKYLTKKAIKNYTEMQIGEMEVTFADTSKATKLLEFKPKTPIEEGIKTYITWFLNYYKEIA